MMNAMIISTFALTLIAFGVSTIQACEVCDAAKNNLPVQGKLVPGTGANAGQVCCVSGGQTYLCQTESAAKATGGLLNNVKILGINLNQAVCGLVTTVDKLLGTELTNILKCLAGVTVTCNPPVATPGIPTVPATIPPTFCTQQCTGGLCCASVCPKTS